jgi:hypothetical protein
MALKNRTKQPGTTILHSSRSNHLQREVRSAADNRITPPLRQIPEHHRIILTYICSVLGALNPCLSRTQKGSIVGNNRVFVI